jgi:uncharacterized membrane protein YfcA
MGLDLLLLLTGAGAGLFGALLGLGGGVVLVPILTLAFGLPLTQAIGTSLVAVVATSAAGAAHNIRSGRADVRLGLTLELGSVAGAGAGGVLAGLLSERLLAGLFAALMVYTVLSLLPSVARPRRIAAAALDPSAPDGELAPAYRSRRVPLALGGSLLAGVTSALLGVGGGVIKVPVMRLVMEAPMHVATATSNFIVGVTGAAGAYAYLFRGDIDALLAAPVVIGSLLGAAGGARLAPRVDARWLTLLFLAVAAWVAFEMARRALAGET